ncbi:MAG TPA: hypothetical protein VF985_06500, partial [Mariniflexile sp.]
MPKKTHHDNASCFDIDIIFNSAEPVIQLDQKTNTLVGYEDPFSVSVLNNSMNFPLSAYMWQYQTVANGTPSPSGWLNMPSSTNGQSSFSILPSSFLSSNDIGKRLYIRTNTCNDLVSENVIFYDLRLSSPHISSVSATPVACFEDENGSIKVNFDRALISGELLSISMTNTTTSIDYSEENITALDTDNSYIINNLPSGDYTVRVIGTAPGYDGSLFNTYSDGQDHSSSFTISEPSPVEFSITKQVDVWCHGGSDGVIEITASGGVAESDVNVFYQYKIIDTNPTVNGDLSQDWTIFSNGNKHIITGLSKDTYKILVKDTNGCEAREIVNVNGGIALGNIIEEPIDITQPNTPVSIDFVFSEQPTAYGFSNGRIRVQITGGTPLANGKYNYIWTHENGTTWTTFTDQVTADGWFLTLENAIAGTYKLTVTDAYYSGATDTAGCTIANAGFTLNEPPLLQLSLTKTHAISCNNTNAFGDESSDGELRATATGGVPLKPTDNNGLPYYYT